jgi:uncharacterized protein (TIGR02246 family)
MRILRRLNVIFLLLSLTISATLLAQGVPTVSESIRAVLDKQVADWNRGDIDAFATGYKNSPDTLFIGQTVHRGYAQMLETYKQHYPNRAAMGRLSFTHLEVQPLDDHFATATGNFHLERTVAGGDNADGYYLLVLEKTADGWKIVRDASATIPPKSR